MLSGCCTAEHEHDVSAIRPPDEMGAYGYNAGYFTKDWSVER